MTVRWSSYLAAVLAIPASLTAADSVRIDGLARELQHPDPGMRCAAAYSLARFGPGSASAVPALVVALADSDPLVRTAAATTLGAIGVAARPAGGALRQALTDKHGAVRIEAALAAWRVDPQQREGLRVLEGALRARDVEWRLQAAHALGQMGPAAAMAVSQLRAALDDPDPGVRGRAAYALGRIGRAAEPARADLQQLAQRDTPEVREWAEGALAALRRGDSGLELQVAAATDPEPVSGPATATARETPSQPPARVNTTEARAAEVLLRRAVTEPDRRIRVEAATALARLDADPAAAVEILVGELDATDWNVRRQAARALGTLGPLAKTASGPLSGLLSDPDGVLRRLAAEGLARIGGPHQLDGLSVLLEALAGGGDPVREWAARVLVEVRPPAHPEIVVALKRALEDSSGAVRMRAAAALTLLREPNDLPRSSADGNTPTPNRR
jgi:HEAT repeat protein